MSMRALFSHGKRERQIPAMQPDLRHLDLRISGRIPAYAGEIGGQPIFQRPDHHLVDAGQVVPLAYRTRDLLQQVQSLELLALPLPRLAHFGDIVEQDAHRSVFRITDAVGAHIEPSAQRARLGFHVHGLPRGDDTPIDFSPFGLDRTQLADQPAARSMQAGLRVECGIDLQEAQVHRPARRIEQDFERAEPFLQ